MDIMKRLWKLSIIRFYWMNTTWNLGFWLSAKPCYDEKRFIYTEETLDLDKNLDSLNNKFELDKKHGSYRKFKGYLYKNGLYLDNPGPQCNVDKETRDHWYKKGWI